MRKGQIAIFMILGFVAAIGIVFLLLISGEAMNPEIEPTLEEVALAPEPIESFIKSCLKSAGLDALSVVSSQGGYYNISGTDYEIVTTKNYFEAYNSSFSVNNYYVSQVPYYYRYNENQMPDIQSIEKEISAAVEDFLPECLDGFSAFDDQGYEFLGGGMKANSTVSLDDVVIALEYPLSIAHGKNSYSLARYSANLEIDFAYVYGIVRSFIDEQGKNSSLLPIGFLTNLASTNNFTYYLITIDNKVFFTLVFNDSIPEPVSPLTFSFLVGYNWSSENYSMFKINETSELKAYPGYAFSHKVETSGTPVAFADYTPLFDINEVTGVIDFVPEAEDIGSHQVMIKAYDVEGNEASSILDINVIREGNSPILKGVGDIAVKIGQEILINSSAEYHDGSGLFYTLQSSLPNILIHPTEGIIYFKPQSGQEGEYTIEVVAIGSNGLMDKKTFNIAVKNE